MPREILRVRGRLCDAFPGFRTTKTSIRAAYEKAGWDINELSLLTKKQVREVWRGYSPRSDHAPLDSQRRAARELAP